MPVATSVRQAVSAELEAEIIDRLWTRVHFPDLERTLVHTGQRCAAARHNSYLRPGRDNPYCVADPAIDQALRSCLSAPCPLLPPLRREHTVCLRIQAQDAVLGQVVHHEPVRILARDGQHHALPRIESIANNV